MPDRKTALITGASFGIGMEFSRIFARESYNLVLVARSADKLRQVASELEKAHGTRSLILAADLSEPGAPPMYSIRRRAPGFRSMCWSTTRDSDSTACSPRAIWKNVCGQIQLNVTTLTHLTRLYLPAMIETK